MKSIVYNSETKSLSDVSDSNLGDCYKVAWRYFHQNSYKNKNLRLVHGLVTGQGPIKGIIYNHAWCEDIDKGVVYDLTMPEKFKVVPSCLYYNMGKIKTVFKYDKFEVTNNSIEFRTYGPWEDILIKNKY